MDTLPFKSRRHSDHATAFIFEKEFSQVNSRTLFDVQKKRHLMERLGTRPSSGRQLFGQVFAGILSIAVYCRDCILLFFVLFFLGRQF